MVMEHILKYASIVIFATVFCGCKAEEKCTPVIVPAPVSMALERGDFTFSPSTTIVVENEEQAATARYLTELFSTAAGFTPAVKVGGCLRCHKSLNN